MRVDCQVLWPTTEHCILHWSHVAGVLAKAHGLEPPLTRPLLLALRGAAPGDRETHQPVHRAKYDDTFVLLVPDSGKFPTVFAGATHAYQQDSKLSPDVNRDGRGDVGSIRCGRYLMTHRARVPHEFPLFVVTMPDGWGEIPCHRDFDHDGVISQAEAERSEQAGSGPQQDKDGCYATGILFHTGFDAPVEAPQRSSIGCLTASAHWLEFMRTTAKPFGDKIDLILANAWDVVPLALEARRLYEDEPDADTVPDRRVV